MTNAKEIRIYEQWTTYFNAKYVFRMKRGRSCDTDKLSELDSSEKVAEAFLQSDYRCKSFREEGISEGPYSTGSPSQDCTHLSEGSDPDCNQSVEGKSRICPCSYDDVLFWGGRIKHLGHQTSIT